MDKYVKDVEEKQKAEEEARNRLIEEKERRHKETLQKIQMQGIERKNKLKEGSRIYKEIN